MPSRKTCSTSCATAGGWWPRSATAMREWRICSCAAGMPSRNRLISTSACLRSRFLPALRGFGSETGSELLHSGHARSMRTLPFDEIYPRRVVVGDGEGYLAPHVLEASSMALRTWTGRAAFAAVMAFFPVAGYGQSLTQVLAHTYENSPTLASAFLSVRAAGQSIRQAEGAYLPSVSAQANLTANYQPDMSGNYG